MTNQNLKYHFHPASGWINDPNGLVYFKGYYHAFFQHTPHYEQPWKEPMVWGHARTKDFQNWEERPVALWADQPYDIGGVWSGTATVRDGMLYVFYASVDADGKQTVSMAFSADGEHFEKYEKNPLIAEYPADGSHDFRDPAIFSENGVNYLIIASADISKKTGNLLLYKSDTLFDWEYAGVLYEYEDSRFCECPSFVKSGDRYLISTSVVKNSGEHYFEVLYGDFNGKEFFPELISHFQKGPDEYAGQIFTAPDGRNIMISWISGWNYSEREQCIGCLSLPLEITVKENEILAYPVLEVRHLLKNDCLTDDYVEERFVDGGREVHITLHLK